jgi:PAS domain S-box-containing protein
MEECRNFQAFSQGEGAHVEDEVLWRADGTSFPAEYWSYPVRRGGQFSGTVVTFVDITERKRAEEALRQSEERLRLALDAGGMGTWDRDIRTDEVVWSDNLEAIFGLPTGSFDGTREGFLRLIHPADRKLVERAIDRSIEEQSGFKVEYRIARQDGSIGWMAGRGRVFTDGNGRPARVIGIDIDITVRKRADAALRGANDELERANSSLVEEIAERQRAERALRESEEKFRQIAENLGEVVWMSDPSTSQMLYINPSCEKIWGCTCQSLYEQPRSFLQAIHPEDRPRILAALSDVESQGRLDEEYRIARPDGSVSWVWARVPDP